MKGIIAACALLLLLTACAPPYLYYGNSSHSYYKAVKKQDDKSVENYKHSLEQVFRVSESRKIPVPPGLYCDYAMLLLNEQRTFEAKQYFEKEKQTWAESTQLMDFLMQRYGLGN